MADLTALQTLLRMPSRSNVGVLPPAALNAAAGYGDFEPSEQDLIEAQDAATTFGPPDDTTGRRSFVTPSRESLRDQTMSKVRQLLRMGDIEQERKLAGEAAEQGPATQRQQIASDATVRAAEIGANQRTTQAEAARQSAEERLNTLLGVIGQGNRGVSIPGVGSVGAVRTPAGAQGGTPTDAMVKRLSEARGSYGGVMGRLGRTIGLGGGREEYHQALTDVLTRQGVIGDLQRDLEVLKSAPGATLEDRVQALGGNATSLSPYEREWLTLNLGL